MEVDLKAGDILYVPWGYPHDAVSGPEISAHLSLMIRPPTWAEVVNGSLHAALNEAVLGESPTWSRSDEALFKEEFLSRLDKALRAASDPGFRDKIAQFAWNAYLQTGMKDEYTSLAELARPAESGQR
jgi:ribosomal protein L16 Arg81 hydroxylase